MLKPKKNRLPNTAEYGVNGETVFMLSKPERSLNPVIRKVGYYLYVAVCGSLCKCGEVHGGFLVCLIGNGAKHCEGGIVQIADVTDTATLHLARRRTEDVLKIGLLFGGRNELIARCDSASHGIDSELGYLCSQNERYLA